MKACFRTSLPICSPSRSQSVQINRILEKRACCCMFFAMQFLSCSIFSQWTADSFIHTDSIHCLHDGGIKELSRWTGLPPLVLGLKVKAREMAQHTRHRNRAVAPLLEMEVEFVVLDVLISRDGMLWLPSAPYSTIGSVVTNMSDSATTEMLSHGLSNCGLLSNAEDSRRRHAVSSSNQTVERFSPPRVR